MAAEDWRAASAGASSLSLTGSKTCTSVFHVVKNVEATAKVCPDGIKNRDEEHIFVFESLPCLAFSICNLFVCVCSCIRYILRTSRILLIKRDHVCKVAGLWDVRVQVRDLGNLLYQGKSP